MRPHLQPPFPYLYFNQKASIAFKSFNPFKNFKKKNFSFSTTPQNIIFFPVPSFNHENPYITSLFYYKLATSKPWQDLQWSKDIFSLIFFLSFLKQRKSKFKSSKHLPTYSHGAPPFLHHPCSIPKKQHHTKALLFPLSLAFFSLFSSFHIGYKDSTFLEVPTPFHDASTPPFFASKHIPSMPLCHPIVTFQKSHPSPKNQEKWSLISSDSRKSNVQ